MSTNRRTTGSDRNNPLSHRTSMTAASAKARAESFELPHEWLYRVARGDPIQQRRLRITLNAQGVETGREWVQEEWYASFEQRMAAATQAAPFYAPRLASHTVSAPQMNIEALRELFAGLASRLPV
jgi:hypothetical protein